MPRRLHRARPAAWLTLATILLTASAARAHDFAITDVLVVLKSNGSYQIDMTVDVDALALGASPQGDNEEYVATLSAMGAAEFEACLERAEDTILRRVRVRFDGDKQRPLISFPELGTPLAEQAELPTLIGTTARLTGRVPDGAQAFTFGASRAFKAVHLTILDQAGAFGTRYTLAPSEDSPPFPLGQDAPSSPAATGPGEVAARYMVLGFTHIVPHGLDHVLFVLGLFLLGRQLLPLLWQVTAFTAAHSVTLGLSMAGVVSLPSHVVEPLIALSIAYVAVENMITSELKPWRLALVFGFGLLHGLGFAGVLRELGLPEGEFVSALVGFNVGVEIGQLAVVGVALLLLGWFREREGYRRFVVLPLSGLIAMIGLYWAFERVFLGG